MKSSYVLVFLACALGLVHIVMSGGGDHSHDCSLPPDNGYSCSSEMGSSGEMGSSADSETAYYFVIEDSMCYPFQYYGCGGNTNRFNDSTFCETYCLLQGAARPLLEQ